MTLVKLLENIKQCHIEYLEAYEDEIKRDEYLKQLRDVIIHYLSQEDLVKKFTLTLFANLLENNIESKDDFSINGTWQAFEALEKYANNLLISPWRKEFRTIKLYGGFYKHKVAKHLIGVEKVLTVMGYQKIDDYTMVFKEPMDPVALIEVSLNCVIASCECELIQDFYNAAIEAGCQCGYKEVYKLRKKVNSDKSNATKYNTEKSYYTNGHSGDYITRDDFKADQPPKREKLHPEDLYEQVRKPSRQSVDPRSRTLPLTKEKPDKSREPLKPETHERHIEASITANLNDLSSGKLNAQQEAETRASTWGYVDTTLAKQRIPMANDEDDLAHRRHQMKAHQLLDGRPQFEGFTPNVMYPYPYPMYGVMAHPMTTFMPLAYPPPPPGYDSRSHVSLFPTMPPPTYEQQLQESMSNTHIDGNGFERGGGYTEQRSQRSSVYDNVLPSDSHDRSSDSMKNRNKPTNSSRYIEPFAEPMLSPPSPFNKDDDALIEFDGPMKPKQEVESKKSKTKKVGKGVERQKELKEDKCCSSSGSSSALSNDDGQWECPSCTMLNKSGDKICTMCSRSKTKGPESVPLVSGGKECAQCTYINEAYAKVCSMCSTKLSHENSSTYV